MIALRLMIIVPVLLAGAALLLGGCASKPLTPPQAPPAVEVLIPVPVPCEVAQVAPTGLPTALTAIPNDIYRAVQLILADREVLKGDREGLVAANSNPCPKAPQ